MYIAQSGFGPAAFRLLTLSDVTSSEQRYMLCSRRVPKSIIEKLNLAIQTLAVVNAEAK